MHVSNQGTAPSIAPVRLPRFDELNRVVTRLRKMANLLGHWRSRACDNLYMGKPCYSSELVSTLSWDDSSDWHLPSSPHRTVGVWLRHLKHFAERREKSRVL